MEESVWVVIGIIGIILVFGIIASFSFRANNDNDILSVKNALDALSTQSEKVCQMPLDTYLAVDVTLVRGVELRSRDGVICVDYDEESYCKRTVCKNNVVPLNLTGAPFRSLEYKCFFKRNVDNLSVECKG
jgi:hypothetical protein